MLLHLRAMLECSVKPVLMEVRCVFRCDELGHASEYGDINAVNASC